MIVSNVSNTKNKLSELLHKVQQGEEVMIVERDRPVARITAIHEDDPVAKLHRLAAEGKARIPSGFGQPWRIDPVKPVQGEFVGALEGLLTERDADR